MSTFDDLMIQNLKLRKALKDCIKDLRMSTMVMDEASRKLALELVADYEKVLKP